MLERLELHHVGPAPKLEFDFAPRLNLITGDNSALAGGGRSGPPSCLPRPSGERLGWAQAARRVCVQRPHPRLGLLAERRLRALPSAQAGATGPLAFRGGAPRTRRADADQR